MQPWIEKNRAMLGRTLVVGGIVPFLCLMGYIVARGNATTPLIVGTFACWALVFVGKTLLKTPTPAVTHD